MPRTLRIAAVQAAPLIAGTSLAGFADEVRRLMSTDPSIGCIVYPELHLFGSDGTPEEQNEQLRKSAISLDGTFINELGEIAQAAGVWLVPGSVCERGLDDNFYNTAVVLSPRGELVASYRKIFPWRPYEFHTPGNQFVVFDIDGVGRIGLSICYDAWFPEVARHLAWMGAEVILNVVKTTTQDRPQEVVLAQANSIVNQTFTVSVNCAGPIGKGRSLIVDPEGAVLLASPDASVDVLSQTIDFEHVSRVRQYGTAGLNRMWSQFLPSDIGIELPLYSGRIDPERWAPQYSFGNSTDDSAAAGDERAVAN